MARRTIENCVIRKRNIKARNEDMVNDAIDGKCGGICDWYDESQVLDVCKQCNLYHKTTV